MESSFQLMIAYDMLCYIKYTAISFSFKDISSLLRSAILKTF